LDNGKTQLQHHTRNKVAKVKWEEDRLGTRRTSFHTNQSAPLYQFSYEDLCCSGVKTDESMRFVVQVRSHDGKG